MKIFRSLVIVTILLASIASTSTVSAGYGCPNRLTVQWGDTLSGIAAKCGTTMAAIQSANPGLGWWVYAGQVLSIPNGTAPNPDSPPATGGTYRVQWGDTLGKIAARSGTSLSSLIAVNPQIANPSLIYAGQVINLPAGIIVPPPSQPTPTTPSVPADSYSRLKIAYQHGLFIRTAPGGTILASALKDDVLLYRTNSVYTDADYKVWVEVRLFKPTKGYYTGWILVKDQLGTYFTEPHIN